ncbi:MAG TPA: porin family protein [Flavobacteriaceae bacterium]|nr:porin family protein [Flavobacteriaceae bacterium]
MKKSLLVAAIAVLGITGMNAQSSFGVTAGLSNFAVSIDPSGGIDPGSETGFYVGALADIGISDAFHVQPAVTYAMTGDASTLSVPIMAKYYVGDSGFNIQAGPQINFLMGDYADLMESPLVPWGDDFSKLGIAVGAGLGYDISESIGVEARYAFQVNNSYTGDGDGTIKHNILNVGAVYKF